MRHKLRLIWFVLKTPTEELIMEKTDAAIANLEAIVASAVTVLTTAQAAAAQATGQLTTLDDTTSAAINDAAGKLSAAIPAPASVDPAPPQ
jgi:hypothetical protein